MTLDSQDLLNLLAYARERHGAPCRVEVSAGWGCTVCELFLRYDVHGDDFNPPLEIRDSVLERILI